MKTLVLVFKKIECEDKTKYDTFYSNSKAEIIINESDIDDVFQSIYTIIISNIQKYLAKGTGWIINSVIEHNISISKYNPLARNSYIKLLKELDHQRKGLINIQNIDGNECFKWSIVRYLNSVGISLFSYEDKEKHPIMYQKNVVKKKHVDLLLIGDEGKRHYVLIKDFNTFMYDHT